MKLPKTLVVKAKEAKKRIEKAMKVGEKEKVVKGEMAVN